MFRGLAAFAGQRLDAAPSMDFFTKFGERQSAATRKAQSFYLLALAGLGLGDHAAAKEALDQAVAFDPNHFWARHYLSKLQ